MDQQPGASYEEERCEQRAQPQPKQWVQASIAAPQPGGTSQERDAQPGGGAQVQAYRPSFLQGYWTSAVVFLDSALILNSSQHYAASHALPIMHQDMREGGSKRKRIPAFEEERPLAPAIEQRNEGAWGEQLSLAHKPAPDHR